MSTLVDRCLDALEKWGHVGPSEDEMAAFVQSEIGRTADPALDDSLSLILYFANEEDRTEFVDVVKHLKPGMRAKRIP